MSPKPSIIADPAPDLTIIGGGIVGLWTAHAAAKDGMAVALFEKRKLASGASGGMLGALMPHQPNAWTPKKQFQLDGLVSLPDRIAALEAETGMDCGYARIGRLMPIGHEQKRRQSAQWVEGSADHWPDDFDWSVIDGDPAPNWASPVIAPHGWNHDTLSARINPRGLTAALIAALRANDRVTIVEGQIVESLDSIDDGRSIVIAAGTGSFDLIRPAEPLSIGTGVKGQGAKLQPSQPVDPASPIIYAEGTYVIAHADGTVAVGSTSENDFDGPHTTDEKLDAVIAHARTICPALNDADIIERWAGVRPKAVGRDPLVGPMPGRSNTFITTGGFKISFAIAHLMAGAALAWAKGETPDIPGSFRPGVRFI